MLLHVYQEHSEICSEIFALSDDEDVKYYAIMQDIQSQSRYLEFADENDLFRMTIIAQGQSLLAKLEVTLKDKSIEKRF